MTSLPDVNLLLALVAAGHTHHAAAREWFETRESDSVAVCRVTQMGLLRLLTNPRVLPSGVYSIDRAWDIANEVLADRRVFFEYEPPELDGVWISLMRHKSAGSNSWTDAYLAAFARQCDFEMVTFDHGFSRWGESAVTILNRPPA
jgi:toxin-antitoxin system PIN domain toxin